MDQLTPTRCNTHHGLPCTLAPQARYSYCHGRWSPMVTPTHTHPTPACIHHPPPPAENKNKLFVTNTRSPSRQARARDKFVQQAIEPRKERLRPRLYGIYKQRPATRPRPPVKFVQRNSLPFKPPKHVITIFRDCTHGAVVACYGMPFR